MKDIIKEFVTNSFVENPVSYFAIKHKARKKTINLWDKGVKYYEKCGFGEPEYGLYYNVAKGVNIPEISNIYGDFETIMFPNKYEPKGFIVDRRWLEGQVKKIVHKLNLPEKHIQRSLDIFMS